MVLNQPLLLLFAHGIAALLFVRGPTLQHEVSQLEQIMSNGHHRNRTAAFRISFGSNAPELLPQVSLFHPRHAPGALRQRRAQPLVAVIGVAALVSRTAGSVRSNSHCFS
jgi:hypothetical protein